MAISRVVRLRRACLSGMQTAHDLLTGLRRCSRSSAPFLVRHTSSVPAPGAQSVTFLHCIDSLCPPVSPVASWIAMAIMMPPPTASGIGAAGLASRAGVIFRAMLRTVTPPLPSSTRTATGGVSKPGRNVSVRYGSGTAAAFLGAYAAGGANGAAADAAVVGTDPTYAYAPKDTYTPTVELQTEVQKSFWGPIGEQLSFGCALGIATGFCLRKLGRMLMVVVGGEVLVLQYMVHRGWAHVGWDKMARDMSPALDGNRFRDSIGLLAYKMPFAGAFTGAFWESEGCRRSLRTGRGWFLWFLEVTFDGARLLTARVLFLGCSHRAVFSFLPQGVFILGFVSASEKCAPQAWLGRFYFLLPSTSTQLTAVPFVGVLLVLFASPTLGANQSTCRERPCHVGRMHSTRRASNEHVIPDTARYAVGMQSRQTHRGIAEYDATGTEHGQRSVVRHQVRTSVPLPTVDEFAGATETKGQKSFVEP